LKKDIEKYRYFWEGNAYPLKLKTIKKESIIYIALMKAFSDKSIQKINI